VAVATTCRVADRSPPISCGRPSGISTRVSTCHSLMPNARAASIVEAGIASRPAYAPARIEGNASTASAASGAPTPTPASNAIKVRTPNVGSARATPVAPTISPRPRPVWPIQ